MPKRHAFLLAGVLLICTAANRGYNPKDCHETAVSQGDLNACYAEDLKKSDAELNDIYKKLMEKISAEGQNKLRTQQKLWVNFRDAECDFETFGTVNATVHPMAQYACQDKITMQQVQNLRAQLNCSQGDVTCGDQ